MVAVRVERTLKGRPRGKLLLSLPGGRVPGRTAWIFGAPEFALGERVLGSFAGKRLALLGAAYRGNSEDTRNSPTLQFATRLREREIAFTIHDPYVHERDANLAAYGVTRQFTRDLAAAVRNADILVLCTPHKVYAEQWRILTGLASRAMGVLDGCNLLTAHDAGALRYAGIGRGRRAPSE